MPSKEFLRDKQQVTLYPTIQQHKKLWEKAKALNMGLNEYIMFCALNAEIKVDISPQSNECLQNYNEFRAKFELNLNKE